MDQPSKTSVRETRVYVLDAERFDPARPPLSVRVERVLVIATLTLRAGAPGEPENLVPCLEAVYGRYDQKRVDLAKWSQAERTCLYEKIRAAEGREQFPLYDWEPTAKWSALPGRIL